MTVDIAGIGFHPLEVEPDPSVEIARVTFRSAGAGAPQPRAQIAGVSFFGTGGPAPDPGRVQIGGLHFFGRDRAPLAGRTLLHMWDGTKLNPVTPMVWNGTGLEKS